MDNFLKNQLYRWTYDKLKENPQKFGTDGCNARYMQEYLREVHGVEVSIFAMKAISTISRIKSDLLLKNPELDFRVKDCSKKRKNNQNHQIQTPTKTAHR